VSNSTTVESDLTRDGVLGDKVTLWQPVRGYRVAIDPILLAATVAPKSGARILDLGCGVGTIALCLLTRCHDVRVDGLELSAKLVDIARRNASENAVSERMTIHQGSVKAAPSEIPAGGFDIVATNPPYLERGHATASPDAAKQSANVESGADLQAWVKAATRALRIKGRLAMIHRADRLDHVLAALSGPFGEITIHPLWPKAGAPAKRVIVHARKGVSSPTRLTAGTVLHQDNGEFTNEAQEALNGGSLTRQFTL
jgi:tRNA1(Val) A37 N6-methylase TrmN6